jgi:hypothetical protein
MHCAAVKSGSTLKVEAQDKPLACVTAKMQWYALALKHFAIDHICSYVAF